MMAQLLDSPTVVFFKKIRQPIREIWQILPKIPKVKEMDDHGWFLPPPHTKWHDFFWGGGQGKIRQWILWNFSLVTDISSLTLTSIFCQILGSIALGEVAAMFSHDTLGHLKKECGGLQTLLKSSHHIFRGKVILTASEYCLVWSVLYMFKMGERNLVSYNKESCLYKAYSFSLN